MSGVTPITPRVSAHLRDLLTQRIPQEAAARRQVLADPRWQVTWDMTAVERASIRAAARAHIADMRERGELLDTVDALMTHAVRIELTRRGWDHDWPPVPNIAPRAGRWPGSVDQQWPAKINARLPADLVARVHAACWHTSAEAIGELRRWRDNHPEVVTEHRAPTLWAQYKALADQVTTPGDVWRQALGRLLAP
ncbi:hypothetical protein AB0F17_34930 [Nonomuraea sp. NPDC026600]|uniref:hypothetical protein n=1 Tax=Nonomuraea sp. NPDC026600 TaxID=3155363 RepID=UPI0033DDEB5C